MSEARAGKLEGKVCLVSGATGMAAATTELAAREGARVFIVSLAAEDCEALAGSIRAAGGVAEFQVADLTDSTAVGEAVKHCVERFRRIDALYNVVGISGRRYGDGPLHKCTEKGWDITLETNVKSMFLLSRQVINQMLAQPIGPNGLRGTLLNMASVIVASPQPDHFATHAYAASKGAVIALSKAMASYYARYKIRVNAIAPGMVRTPMSQRAQGDEAIMEFIKAKQPLPEGIIEAEEIARASVFLLSDESRYITGNVLTLDGGWSVS